MIDFLTIDIFGLIRSKMTKLAWRDAGWWLAFTAVGFVAPVLIGMLVRWSIGAQVNLDWVAGGGQFALSSAGLLMTAYYFVARPSPIPRMPHTGWFLLFSLICLLLVATFVFLATLDNSERMVDQRFYQWPSIGLFVATLIIVFIAVGVDNTRQVDEPGFLEENLEGARATLADEFEATFSGGGQP